MSIYVTYCRTSNVLSEYFSIVRLK